MAIAAFANKTFQVSSKKIYTFDEFSTGTALQTERQDVAGKKPSTYIKGPDLDTMSFTIPLNIIIFRNDVLYEYDSWKAIMAAQKAYSFILGNKPIGGKWLLTSVALSDTIIDKKGTMTKAKLQLQFEEYVRPGAASVSKSSKKSKSKKSTTKGVSQSDKSILNSLISGEKSSQKRNNTNASAAVSKGAKK